MLRPNERLIEEVLAETLQVSRTPVRESFKRLAAEGLIVNRRRGWVVYEYSADEIRQIYETRAAIEGYAARLAAERATAAQLEAIQAIFDAPSHFQGSTARATLVSENEKFHDAITAAAGNLRLAGLIESTRLYYFNQRIANFYTDQNVADARLHHARILESLHRRDADAAMHAVYEDIRVALEIIQARG